MSNSSFNHSESAIVHDHSYSGVSPPKPIHLPNSTNDRKSSSSDKEHRINVKWDKAPPDDILSGPKILSSKIDVKKEHFPSSSDWGPYESFDNVEFTRDEDNNSKVIGLIKFKSPQINYDADDSSPPPQGHPITRNHCPYSRRQSSCGNRVKCTSLPKDTNIRKPRGRGHGRGHG